MDDYKTFLDLKQSDILVNFISHVAQGTSWIIYHGSKWMSKADIEEIEKKCMWLIFFISSTIGSIPS